MGLNDTEALVLRSYKLAEADKIVIFLTRDCGVVRGVARGARRLQSKFGAGLEPFTRIQLSFFEKEGRELVSVRHLHVLNSRFGLARHVECVSTLDYLSQVIVDFSPPHQSDDKLYRMVNSCVEAIAKEPESHERVRVYFEAWMLKLAGLLPDLQRCGACRSRLEAKTGGVRAGADGVLFCPSCSKGRGAVLSREAYGQLLAIRSKGAGAWAEDLGTGWSGREGDLARYTSRLVRRALDKEVSVKKLPPRSLELASAL